MLVLLSIMASVAMVVAGFSVLLLYRTASDENKARLVATAQSQARLVEAVARFNVLYSRDYP